MKYSDRVSGRWDCESVTKFGIVPKFIVGDRVRVVGDNEYCRGYSMGEFTIIAVYPLAPFPNLIGFLGGAASFKDDELELVTEEVQHG